MNETLISWSHEVIPLDNRGIEVYRVISHGIVRDRLLLRDFLAISYVAHVGEKDIKPVEMVFTLSNGRRIETRPEVELEKCLKRILWWGSY